jgi:uncharacterized damage-inducible protein DinB
MDTKTCKLLAQYNKKTNAEMNSFIRSLSSAQWKKEFKGYYKSICELCNHIYIGDINWLKRFGSLRPFEYRNDGIFTNDYKFRTILFDSIDEYAAQRIYLDSVLVDFIDELNEQDLLMNLEYKSSKNESQNRNMGGLILHMFNHQTHHRGMISVYLDSMGIENDYSSLFLLV